MILRSLLIVATPFVIFIERDLDPYVSYAYRRLQNSHGRLSRDIGLFCRDFSAKETCYTHVCCIPTGASPFSHPVSIDTWMHQKRPTKETYERDLQKRPTFIKRDLTNRQRCFPADSGLFCGDFSAKEMSDILVLYTYRRPHNGHRSLSTDIGLFCRDFYTKETCHIHQLQVSFAD